MLLRVEDLATKLHADASLKSGCIIDTNVLFAAAFPLDTHNEWAEKVFQELHKHDVPIFTNVNVRSEFLELNRRALIPEGLVDLYDDLTGHLDPTIEQSLKSLKTRKSEANKNNKTFKLGDMDIKKYRKMLEGFKHSSGKNGWELFCKDYFDPYIKNVWEDAVEQLKLKFLGTRALESQEHFESDPQWSGVTEIIGMSGIGSADAMIVNLFRHSKLAFIVTTDSDVRDTVIKLHLAKKFVLSPT